MTPKHRQVLLMKDLDGDALEAIRTAKPSERSRALDYLMDDLPKRTE